MGFSSSFLLEKPVNEIHEKQEKISFSLLALHTGLPLLHFEMGFFSDK